jgi:hypothetical protein
MVLGWDKLKKLLAGAFTWTGTQTFTDIVVNGVLSFGTIAELSVASNVDIDTGTETVDSLADTDGKAAFWDYVAVNGANIRAGRIMAAWDEVASSTPVFAVSSTADIGDTSGVTFDMDKSGNTVRLRCTVTSDNWAVYATRSLLG